MEKRLQVIFLLIFLFFPLFSQTPSVVEHIRIPLWAELDAYPELLQNSEIEAESYPIKKIREVAPFLISGMVYGWDFVYTPSDAVRNVEEYFELPIWDHSLSTVAGIVYSAPDMDIPVIFFASHKHPRPQGSDRRSSKAANFPDSVPGSAQAQNTPNSTHAGDFSGT